MSQLVSWEDIVKESEAMKVDPCILLAICKNETNGSGFLPDGRPKILFEAHQFYRELKKVGLNPDDYRIGYPTIISKTWNRDMYAKGTNTTLYYRGPISVKRGILEHERLTLAKSIHNEAALKSCSWGTFQIMGFNYKTCGYDSVIDFVDDMYFNANAHLKAFCGFLKGTSGMITALRNLDYRTIARKYNGSGYEKNKYHTKLQLNYENCKRS